MRALLQYASWIIGLPLELLIIAALIRGPYRRLPFVFIYTLALFLTTVVEMPVNAAYLTGVRLSHSPAFYYWIDEGVLQVLVYAVVISLIYGATEEIRSRTLVRTALTGAAAVFAGGILSNPLQSPRSNRDVDDAVESRSEFHVGRARPGFVGHAPRFTEKGYPAPAVEWRTGNSVYRRGHRSFLAGVASLDTLTWGRDHYCSKRGFSVDLVAGFEDGPGGRPGCAEGAPAAEVGRSRGFYPRLRSRFTIDWRGWRLTSQLGWPNYRSSFHSEKL